jgi:lactate permease
MAALIIFLRVWRPRRTWRFEHDTEPVARGSHGASRSLVARAWTPWIILSVVVFAWGLPSVKSRLDAFSTFKVPVSGVHQMINRVPPVVRMPAAESAIFVANWMTAVGSGILLAALISGLVMGFTPWKLVQTYVKTIVRVRFSLLTVAAMMALGFLTRYSGLDATMGLAFARTGVLYPFFGTMLGWLGVALTGSDLSSNVLFGSLQTISAQQVGVSPTLMAAANSSGGVMGKMIDAQSIVVASTATEWYGHEGDILRYVFFHSLALAALVGILVTMQAYLPPFTHWVVR